MAFENPLPWWVLTFIVLAAAAVAWQTYRHMPASPARRASLTTLRLAALLTIVLFLMRPVASTIQRAFIDRRSPSGPVIVMT